MPSVNWEVFANLPGSAERNFEMLCRALIRRHYSRYGEFAALANQPGVEFHLKLRGSCSLGDVGRWYGWQSRWYDLPDAKAIGTTRRARIEKAMRLTEKVLPGLTDWVLWTRRPLTKGDQQWFKKLSRKTPMQLHLWTAVDVEEHLSGEAEIFRSTYFGELVLTPESLVGLHEVAVAPVRHRWMPEVHQIVDAERELRRMLVETNTWKHLHDLADRLEAEATAADADVSDLTGGLGSAAQEVTMTAHTVAAALLDAHEALTRGDLDLLRQQNANDVWGNLSKLARVPHQLRAYRHRAALTVTNALADVRRARDLFDTAEKAPSTRVISVLADAGYGKTQLAAQLTASGQDRPPGILLHGSHLRAGSSLDDLAHRVVIQSAPVSSMEALVGALDAAGQRARRRLPIVIDGLNEAEDLRDWKG
ncbi:MAG: hypothetical protein DMF60_15510, partial [Acidobacteria bacterium]